MDIFLPIVICVVLFIIFSICGWCCKRNRQGTVYGGAPVAVTSTTTYGVSNPPYPVDMPMPQPQIQPAMQPGFNVGGPIPPYPTQPQTIPGYPPAPGPGFGTGAPYPPMMQGPPYPTHPAPGQQPPSYAEAVTQPPPTTNELYAKQAPYNPNY